MLAGVASAGADLALLLLGSYRALVDSVVAELDQRGHCGVRPVHDFALRAIDTGADSAAELGRRMSVTKQAAAKTIATLVERGYVTRVADPSDGRRKQLVVTDLGRDVMAAGEAIFDDLHRAWQKTLGADELAALEAQLTKIVGDSPVRVEAPGWVVSGS
jgi:DNA-binding MarR family transcriptional regulator